MKKLNKVLSGILCLSMLGQACPVFADALVSNEEIYIPFMVDGILGDDEESTALRESNIIYKLCYDAECYRKEHEEVNICAIFLGKKHKEEDACKLIITVRDEKSGTAVEEYLESLGYNKDILVIIVVHNAGNQTYSSALDNEQSNEAVPPSEDEPVQMKYIRQTTEMHKSFNADENANFSEIDYPDEFGGAYFDKEINKGVLCLTDVETYRKDYEKFFDLSIMEFKEVKYNLDTLYEVYNFIVPIMPSKNISTCGASIMKNAVEVTVLSDEDREALKDYLASEGYDPDIITFGDNSAMNTAVCNVALLGDINLDGIFDMSDLTDLSLYLLGDKEFSDAQIYAADIDGDRKITVADLARLKQYVSKVITSFR